MLTGELRSQVDAIWNAFWTGGISNPMEVEMHQVVGEHVFPFLRTLGGTGSTYATHMKDARFTIPTPALLAKVVDLLDHVRWTTATPKGTCTNTC